MQKYTFKQKLDYNKKRGGAFGNGYVAGAKLYTDYPKFDKDLQNKVKKLISSFSQTAKLGSESAKGFLSGVRDAANERKNAKR